MKPLADRMRPNNLNDIVGQQHLIGANGVIRKCLEQNKMYSSIFYGNPGTGKTTLAIIIANELKLPYRIFNATTGNKKELDEIFKEAATNSLVLILDEIHRLNKDKQDLLLSYIENGNVILIGITTSNPFHSINPAIRSRCNIFQFKPLTENDIQEAIKHALESENGLNNKFTISEEALQKLSKDVNGDVRSALRILELASTICNGHIEVDDIQSQLCSGNIGSTDSFYDLLSAFQKSIRGSDVNAALYYFALLIKEGDMDAVIRRLLIIAYEDIGLGNPATVARTLPACQTALQIGLPEAILPLGMQIIDLCLSGKSKVAHDATHKAVDFVENTVYEMPEYLKSNPIGLDSTNRYNHYRKDCYIKLQYLPDEIKDIDFIGNFGRTKNEQQLSDIYNALKKINRSSDLKKVYEK